MVGDRLAAVVRHAFLDWRQFKHAKAADASAAFLLAEGALGRIAIMKALHPDNRQRRHESLKRIAGDQGLPTESYSLKVA